MRIVSTLRSAFTVHYIIAAAVPIVLFAVFSFQYINQSLLAESFRTNAFLAHEVRAQVEDFLNLRALSLQHVASAVYGNQRVGLQSVDHYLAEEVENSHDFESIYILDRSGRIVHLGLSAGQRTWEKDYRGVDLSGHELFKRFRQGEAPGWSDTYTSLVNGEPSISLGITAGDHLVIGNLSLRHLGEIVSRFSLFDQPLATDAGAGSLLFAIVDRKGVPIAHTDVNIALRQQSMRIHTEILSALGGTPVTSINVHDGGRRVESGLAIPETGWAVWISRDFEMVSRPLETTREVFYTILAASVLVAVLFGLVTARSVLGPLGVLVQGVRSLATGAGNFPKSRQSYAEIDELTRGFHRMSQSVRDREMSLRDSENRYRSLVNSIEGIVFEADYPDMTFRFVSERSEQILGYPADAWLEQEDFWEQAIHPDDRQWAYSYSHNQAGRGRSHQFEYRMLHREGHVVWVRQMANVVSDKGDAKRLIGVLIDVTGSKEAAISLQESEQRFRSLVEQAADAIFIFDLNGQMVDVNEQACRSLGYSREELKRRTIPDIQILQSPLELATLQNSVARGGSLTFEAEHRRKNNTAFPVEIRLGSFLYQDRPLFLALVRDITERKQAVAALRESEERYRTVVSVMAEGVVLVDNEGLIVAVNPAAERILQDSADDIIGLNFESDRWVRVRDDGLPFEIEQLPVVITRKSGEPVDNALVGFPGEGGEIAWMEVTTRPVAAFGEGRYGGVLVTLNDVTEKRAASKALRESEERVRLLLDSTAEGIFGLDLDRKCTFCNPAALTLFGYTREEEVLGRDTHELFHHSLKDGTPYPVADCPICGVYNSGEEAHSDTETFWRADGSSFSVEYFARPIIKDEALVGVVVAFHDITSRKLLQQQNIRTAQLASLGELAAGVAHEINNPISGVINYAQILLNQAKKAESDTDLVERIIKEGERVATIVRDLLFFSRESGPEKTLSDIREVLEDSLSLTAAQIKKEGIALHVDCPPDLPLVSTRAQQIQQLFLNILSNARHALNEKFQSHNPDKRIDIAIEQVEHAGEQFLRIVFTDYGVGIPEQMLERVLHPFVTSKAAGVGTGLGLSISFEIVKNHGGKFWIESVEGESTTVYIELPVAAKEA